MDFSLLAVAGCFALGLVIGMPVAFVLIMSSLVGIFILRGEAVALTALTTMPYAKSSDLSLAVIPLFILMGYLASAAGISEYAYRMAYRWVGHLKGGLAVATVFACAAFAATSGSSVATSATLGKIAMAEMKRFRYDDAISAGTIASAGLLGIMIPPSIMMIVYGIVTQTNIALLFLAGILPGILTAIVFAIGLYLLAWWKPHLMPTSAERFSWSERFSSLRDSWAIWVLFTVIIGGIYTGIFTATESAAVGAIVALLLMFYYRKANLRTILSGSREAAGTCAMIFLILIGAGLFSQYVALAGLATDFARFLTGLELSPYAILFLILLAYIPLGMFLEPISMCLITLPIVFPAVMALGFDPIWFGVIIVKICEISNITPPLGLNVFVIRGINKDIPVEKVFKGVSIFVVMELLILLVLVMFPSISLFIPQLAN
ncbi:MAG: TRAP transporter large permease [Rhizobiaceae bacterium]|nr:TRAP transporter large permease [Rhizobiaceae bacterium]